MKVRDCFDMWPPDGLLDDDVLVSAKPSPTNLQALILTVRRGEMLVSVEALMKKEKVGNAQETR